MSADNDFHRSEIAHLMHKNISGEVRIDNITRTLYSTDASVYQIEPIGVVFPKTLDDIEAIVSICAENRSAILARGSGSSLAGQAVGQAWIVDCSRYLDQIIEINPEEHFAWVEPGVILNALNRKVAAFNLQFGPDPASAERASMGGTVANNGTGAHSICYGMAADHLLAAEVVLADGRKAVFKEMKIETAEKKSTSGTGNEANFYKTALALRREKRETIMAGWPRTWRRASGYNLSYLIGWSPTAPVNWGNEMDETPSYPPISANSINLAHLIAGSEGTLGVIQRLKINLVRKPKHTVLAALGYPDIFQACDDVPELLESEPSAVELIPQTLIQLAQSIPAYAPLVSSLKPLIEQNEQTPALLVIEYSGDDPIRIREKAQHLAAGRMAMIAESLEAQQKIWGVRKVGLGLFMSRAGDAKPWSFIEDLSVPVEKLGEFVRELYRILEAFHVEGENYGHASAGCLHIRPIINLKTVSGVRMLRDLSKEAVELTLRMGGSISGEHGDGLARSEWTTQMFGENIADCFREIKQAADPDGILNPGKIIALDRNAPLKPMNAQLRFGEAYAAKAWDPIFDYSKQASLAGAIEQCNGAGVCRKFEGVMCPSFQATREEMHSTRGRANLLRAMISGKLQNMELAENAAMSALDLCLACKGCKAECPSAVDMAKLKYEFLERHYQSHKHRWRDYLFGYIHLVGKWSQPLWFIANPLLRSQGFRNTAGKWLGISPDRPLPQLARRRLSTAWRYRPDANSGYKRDAHYPEGEQVLFLSDPFTEYFYPEAGIKALQALEMAGCSVRILKQIGSGRTLISKGFLGEAKKWAEELVREIETLDPERNCAIVGVEPSEILTLMDEYPDLLPKGEGVSEIAKRTYSIEEYMVRPGSKRNWSEENMGTNKNINKLRIVNTPQHNYTKSTLPQINKTKILLHGHCYQKARPPADDGFPTGEKASKFMLEQAGFDVTLIDSGCCGMAGAFGYESEHKDISMQVGELSLLPAIREADESTIIAAAGVSCRAQIEDGTGRKAYHPIECLFLD